MGGTLTARKGTKMTLKQALKVTVDTKYRITMKHLDGEYETITVDYLGDDHEFSKARARREEFSKMNHKVQWITHNSASDCLEITLYEVFPKKTA